MVKNRSVGISDDYAILRVNGLQFYYGYEETNDSGDWLFVVHDNCALKMRRTAKQLGFDDDESPERVLLGGIGAYLKSTK